MPLKKNYFIFSGLHYLVQLFLFLGAGMKGREVMKETNGEKSLKERIREGEIRRRDVTRRLAELAFGKANDCVRLALEDDPRLDKLDLSLLSEVKRNDKGTVEIKLIDRLRALEQLALVAEEEKTIFFGLSGTGYFDLVAYEQYNNGTMADYTPSDEELEAAMATIPQV